MKGMVDGLVKGMLWFEETLAELNSIYQLKRWAEQTIHHQDIHLRYCAKAGLDTLDQWNTPAVVQIRQRLQLYDGRTLIYPLLSDPTWATAFEELREWLLS